MKNERTIKDCLYSDCETDEEFAIFFESGRGHETGIISLEISKDVAQAFRDRANSYQESSIPNYCKMKGWFL